MVKDYRVLGGLALIVAGVILGLYVGLWLLFIGGIAQIINGIKMDFNALYIAVGIARIMMSGVAGFASALILIIPGRAIIKKEYRKGKI